MKNRLIYAAVIICMIISLVSIAVAAPEVSTPAVQALPPSTTPTVTPTTTPAPTTWYVDDNGSPCPDPDYPTIQQAIDAARPGDTIIVCDGTYNEQLDIHTSLTILSNNGAGSTFIGQFSSYIANIDITADSVTLGGTGHGFDIYGFIDVESSYFSDPITGISIVNNKIHNDGTYNGIRFLNNGCATISDNTISGNIIYDSHDGIQFNNYQSEYDIKNNTITGNNIYYCGNGISFYNYDSEGDVYNNTVDGNNIHDCDDDGILFDNSHFADDTLWGNIRNNTIQTNSISYCKQGIDFIDDGYDRSDISYNTVTGNAIHDCAKGIRIYGCGFFSYIYENTISNNEIWYCDEDEASIGIYIEVNSLFYLNTVQNNEVYHCTNGIALASYDGASYHNIVSDNEIWDCYYTGISLYAEDYSRVTYNLVTGNNVSQCNGEENSAGIRLNVQSYGYVSHNTVDGNTVYQCKNGIRADASYGELTSNTISNNTIYDGEYHGIYLHAYNDGYIAGSTIEGNTVYGWGGSAIRLNDESATTIENIDILDNVLYIGTTGNNNGIVLYYCDYITVRGNDIRYSAGLSAGYGLYIYNSDNISVEDNTIQYNNEGIQITSSDYVDIVRNDIRDNNPENDTGIRINASYNISASCNNIVGNGDGIYLEDVASRWIDACNNWWGDAGGPGVNGSNGIVLNGNPYGVEYDPWLTADVSLCTCPAPAALNTEAVPAAVSLYDMITESDGYSLGPDYTDLIVETECPDADAPCCRPAVTVNLSAFLMGLLPADFETNYVSQWSDMGQYWWGQWIDYLNAVPVENWDGDEDTCFLDYELDLDGLLFDDWDYIYHGSLEDLFEMEYRGEYNGREQVDTIMVRLLAQEMHTGLHQVPVTLTNCNGSATVYVPLVVSDFQLPLAGAGQYWDSEEEEYYYVNDSFNLRSTPVTLDPDWDTLTDIMGDGIDDIVAFWSWNASQGKWVEPGPATVFAPLTSYYIIMANNSTAQMRFVVERGLTAPPTRNLPAGWNLVAPAPPYEEYEDCSPFPSIDPWDSLYSVGWTQAVNPDEDLWYEEHFYYDGIELDKDPYWKEFEQEGWEALWGDEPDYNYITAGGGFWAYIAAPDVLAGYSYTPVPLDAFKSW